MSATAQSSDMGGQVGMDGIACGGRTPLDPIPPRTGAGVEVGSFLGNVIIFNKKITFDRKMNPEWQLMFSKSSITDGITHVSKQRELVRTV